MSFLFVFIFAPGLCQETDVDIGLSPETRIASAQDPSHSRGGIFTIIADYDNVLKMSCLKCIH